MSILAALILGLVEGLTEFVPVSSTGHLILTSRVLGLSGPLVDSFSVVIQLGALLAAAIYYRRLLGALLLGLVRREPTAARLMRSLCLGALPLLVIGLWLGKRIKGQLFTPTVVATSLLVGGLLMLIIERFTQRRRRTASSPAEPAQLSSASALGVGCAHALALCPGMSRSMSSLLGALLVGLPRTAAADYAFLLAFPTLGLATVYELLKTGPLLLASFGWAPLLTGLLTSFLVGWIVIAAFLGILRRIGLWPFACYRILFGGALLIYL